MTKKSVLYIRSVPNDVKKEFKVYCAEHGLSMSSAIIEFMRKMGLRRRRTRTGAVR